MGPVSRRDTRLFSPGQVWNVDFPFAESPDRKKNRYGLVIAAQSIPKHVSVLFAPISTFSGDPTGRNPWSDVEIDHAKLRRGSYIRPLRLWTADLGAIHGARPHIDRIPEDVFGDVLMKIVMWLPTKAR